jgi:large subunit ribosomal protein L25
MKLSVKKRDIYGKKVKSLRAQGLVPAVIYGKHVEAESISCVKNDLLKVYKASGYSTPVELTGDVNHLVLINALQLDPVSDEIISADFLAVSRTEKVSAKIPVVTFGESQLEKLNEGKIMQIRDEVEVEALPQDLPSKFEVDISVLQTVNDVFFIKDLKVSDKVTILDDPELPILTVSVIEDEPAE